MAARILLVNPPIYDFAAYDFWLKPYGLLSVGGMLRGKAEVVLLDCLDREESFMSHQDRLKSDRWERGRFYCEQIPSPRCLSHIRRYFRRFGLPRKVVGEVLRKEGPFDFVLVATMMTYWYPGVAEVIEDIRRFQPRAKIILGGNYVTLCKEHAEKLGADLLVAGGPGEELWRYLGIDGDADQPALWEGYRRQGVGVLRLSDGCPFNCTYCCAPRLYGGFKPRPLGRSVAELELLVQRGVRNIAFYDDALLFEADKVLVPFLEEVLSRNIKVNFHTPNALGARFMTRELAELMVRVGFRTFYIGFESKSAHFQQRTGSKVRSEELAEAVEHLTCTGAERTSITAYHMLGHPGYDIQQLDESMRFVNRLGIRGMLADFSPIPGTVDGEYCRKWVDMDEPLMHNKTAFAIILLGFEEVNRIKELQRRLNRSLSSA